MAQEFPLQAQAEEISLRVIEELDFIAKNRGKKPAEMIGCMMVRVDCLKEASETLFWLAKNEDLVRKLAGEAKSEKKPHIEPEKPKKADEAPKTVISAPPAEKTLPEGWEIVNGRVFNEDGDLVPDFFTDGA